VIWPSAGNVKGRDNFVSGKKNFYIPAFAGSFFSPEIETVLFQFGTVSQNASRHSRAKRRRRGLA
jgi:hypothetical protein